MAAPYAPIRHRSHGRANVVRLADYKRRKAEEQERRAVDLAAEIDALAAELRTRRRCGGPIDWSALLRPH